MRTQIVTTFAVLVLAGCVLMHIDSARVSGLGSTVGAHADMPPPAPPPIVDAVWMVFFDSDKASLSAEAQAVIAEMICQKTAILRSMANSRDPWSCRLCGA